MRFCILASAVCFLASYGPARAQVVDSGPTHHAGRIDTSEVWYSSGNPHILDDDVYTGNNVTLTIMPACTVMAEYGAELYVGYAEPGTIIADGTADSMIAFTSNIPGPQPGDWRGVGIYGLARNATRFSYCDISYAGSRSGSGAFYVYGVAPSLDHCRISQSGDFGVVAIHNGRFGSFADNTITTCANYPVRIEVGYASTLGSGNVLTGNTKDGVLLAGTQVINSGTWLNHGVPYVADDVAVGDATNMPVLTISPGTTVELMPHGEFYVGYAAPGGLIADGTAGQIVFTSAVESPSPGDWCGLSFYSSSISNLCRLTNCKVEYGGQGIDGNILIRDCTPEVRGNSIGHSSVWGIYLEGSEYPPYESLRWSNTFYDCASGAVGGPGVAVTVTPSAEVRTMDVGPTIVRGALFLPEAVGGERSAVGGQLLDTSGRKVLDLHPGANDVRALAPGVYFVRLASGVERSASSVRKVIVTR